MRRRMLAIGVALAAAAAGVAAYYRANVSAEAPRLNTVAAARGSVVQTVDATGTLAAVETVEVGTQVSGTIKALQADYNSRVRKGQVIAQLEPSLFQTQVEGARATVQRLQAEVDAARVRVEDAALKAKRARELSARELIPATDLETAEATARQAEASLKAAEAQLVQGRAALNQSQVNLGHTTIVAPIDGIVISRNVDVGQTVAASMSAPTLFVLARDLTRMQVNAKIDEADIGQIQAGQPASFGVDAYPGKTFSGTVRQVRLEPVVEQNVVTYVTVIDVPNPQLELKPGMTATVAVEVARADEALRVPNAALQFRPTEELLAALGQPAPGAEGAVGPGRRAGGRAGARAGVWVLADGRLQRRPVQTGPSDGAVTAVVGGELEEGEQIVTGSTAVAAAAAAPGGSPLLPQRRFGGSRPQGNAR